MADSAEEIQKHIKTYFMVGAILVVGTLITVAVAKFPIFDLGATRSDSSGYPCWTGHRYCEGVVCHVDFHAPQSREATDL